MSATVPTAWEVLPGPGTDLGLLVRLLPQISAEFGLTPAQLERLAPERRIVVYKAVSAAGGVLVGKVVTHELVLGLVKRVGLRLSAQQAAKYVPLAARAVSAALRHVCEQHFRQCMAVARQLQLPSP